jgi:hypothetical protein
MRDCTERANYPSDSARNTGSDYYLARTSFLAAPVPVNWTAWPGTHQILHAWIL